MEKQFFKLVCLNEDNPFEYEVLEDVNRGTLDEVHDFVKENIHKYDSAKWILIPHSMKMEK